MPLRKTNGKTDLDSYAHEDKRLNIPTEELRDFVAEEEQEVKVLLYPRDPSLDPQLVWQGKDEQDEADLAVEARPIYIQEKIHPRAIIEDIRAHAGTNGSEPQAELFDDFDGLEFEEIIDFYKHQQNWANRMILGDSLQVMGSLAEKEGLRGKVQTVYIDPPYGIRFGSNWQVSTRKRDVTDGKAEDATRDPEQVKAFRDTWEKHIHTYLAYLRDRLVVARDLLTESGSVFVQIGDDNVHLVRSLMDEVFGSENFVSQVTFQTTSGFETTTLASVGDFLLWYAKDKPSVKVRKLFEEKFSIPGQGNATWVLLPDGTYRGVSAAEKRGEALLPGGALLYKPDNIQGQGASKSPQPFTYQGKTYDSGTNSHWKANYPVGMQRLAHAGRIHVAKNSIQYRRFATDFPYRARGNVWTDTATGSFTDDKLYVVQTNTKVVERCLLMTTDPGDLVLDPTCGSGTTAYVAEQWGRRWITIDTSRVALALARTRLMAAKYPYYLLADSPEGAKKEAELTGQVPSETSTNGDLKKGFVYRRAPHVTLESIANNPDIREGMELEEVAAAIARRAESETLFDQPYADDKRLRVAGPFTVESLSPHRVLSTDGNAAPAAENDAKDEATNGKQFVTTILENLKRAGVQNTVKQERLNFDRLEPYAGVYVNAEGEYTEQDGSTKRVAVCVGPEHGTVGPELVKDAAKEAVQGIGFDLLVVCGFAFDPHVAEEATRYGKLTVLVARMNPDLAMGDELLKKTGAGNLFMVFGEPDIEVEHGKDGKLTVEIRGVDVYDPTTGQIRSNSTDDIACWFVDTDYDEESFFVRHAYFTGADKPYEKLKKTLKAEIDEEAWAALYSTRSRPFDPPEHDKIAIKVINHYGDEVMKVCKVASTAPGSPRTS